MDRGWSVFTGMGLGAGLMYVLDPDAGRRRRKTMADKAVSLARQSADGTGRAARDLSHRAQGLVTSATRRFHDEDVDDVTLAERVRARLGRVVSHPAAVEVAAEDGRVLLRGPILEDEVGRLLRAVRRVPGVLEIDDQLEPHETRDGVPALQGGVPRAAAPELLQENWAPAIRFLAAATGCGLMALGLRRRDGAGAVLGTVGAALLARATTNKPLRKLIGLHGGPKLVEVQKTIRINAPVDQVFGLWIRYENFPRFMSTLKEVRDIGDGRSRWTVEGPGGVPVSWNAEITRLVPNQVLAWKSEPGSLVSNAGIIHFEPSEDGGTRVDIRLSYDPPAGALGHVVAKLFGADPKSQMDEDLLRMKTFLETGRPPHDAAVPEKETAPVS